MVPSKEVYSLKDSWDSWPTCSDRQADDRGVAPAPAHMSTKTPSRYKIQVSTHNCATVHLQDSTISTLLQYKYLIRLSKSPRQLGKCTKIARIMCDISGYKFAPEISICKRTMILIVCL